MMKTKILISVSTLIILFCGTVNVLAQSLKQINGEDRYETSVKISQEGWKQQSKYIVLATGEDFPDALCAAPLAKKMEAPLLLNPKANLLPNIKNEIVRLGAKQVIIIGGSGAISEKVIDQLKAMNIQCSRIFGSNRYETSTKIAEELGMNGEIAVATGENFPDAISISAIAAQKGMPILLTQNYNLPSNVADYIKNKTIKATYIIGGNDVVSDKVSSKLTNVTRLEGPNRYDTNMAVIKHFSKDLNYNSVYFATGEDFPDALIASVLAAKTNSPIYLEGDTTNILNDLSTKADENINIISIGDKDNSDLLPSKKDSLPNIDVNNNEVVTDDKMKYYTLANKLFKVSKNGGSPIVLDEGINKKASDTMLESVELSNLNIQGDWLYYSEITIKDYSYDMVTYSGVIYKIKTDGTEKTKICTDTVSEMKVLGNSIYYTNKLDENQLYKINIDGGMKRKLSDDKDCYQINVLGDSIYYLAFGPSEYASLQLSKINLDSNRKINIPIKINTCPVNYNLYDNKIYFLCDFYDKSILYKMNLDGSGLVSLFKFENRVWYMNISNGRINYYPYDNYDNIFSRKIDGTDLQKSNRIQ